MLSSREDVAHVAAHVLAGKGKQGFDDRHCGQMMVVTGTPCVIVAYINGQ